MDLVTYHECIADVDNESFGARFNGLPFVICKNLKPPNMILMQYCQGSWITMRTCAQGKPWIAAYWIVITSHDWIAIFKKLSIIWTINSQANCQEFHYCKSQIFHCFTVVLIDNPTIYEICGWVYVGWINHINYHMHVMRTF